MKNYIHPGQNLTLTASADLKSGQGLLIGALFGVVQSAVSAGEAFVLCRGGVYALPKATGAAWAEGDKLYWNDTAKELTKTASGNTLVGAAVSVAIAEAAVGEILLDGVIR